MSNLIDRDLAHHNATLFELADGSNAVVSRTSADGTLNLDELLHSYRTRGNDTLQTSSCSSSHRGETPIGPGEMDCRG